MEIFIKKKYDSLFTSSIIKDYLVWKKNYNILKSNYDYKRRKPRQLIKKQFLENGSFYIFDKNTNTYTGKSFLIGDVALPKQINGQII